MTTSTVHQHWLANGMHLLGERNTASKSAALGFFVKTGARDEVQAESGVSHFLEHMVFKGTAQRSALDITYHLGNIGAQANAYTSEETTVYYAAIIPEYFGAFQEILSDMVRPALDPHEYDTEKNVILEEIALYLDKPHFFLYERAISDYYGGHPAGNSVLGSIDSIKALTRDQMKDYYDRRYSPSNLTLIASGKFEWEEFVAAAEQHCGGWREHPVNRATSPHRAVDMQRIYTKEHLQQAHVMLMSDGAHARDEARYGLSLLAFILGDSSGSKLYWELIDKGIAESASCDNDEKDGTGCFTLFASCEPDRMDRVVSIIRGLMAKPLDFTDAELERAKTKLATKVVLSGELPMSRLMALGNSWTYREEIHDLRTVLDKIQRMTRRDIEQALEIYPLKTWSEFRLVPA